MKHILLSVVICFSVSGLPSHLMAQESKTTKMEKRANRNFIRLKFDKAMKQYEAAINHETDEKNKASMHIRSARLYFMLCNYPAASAHYEQALGMESVLFSVDDICNYIDALRFSGENKKAEALCLNYAYKDIYSKHQRYKNILEALSMKHAIIPDEQYSVHKLSLNSNNSEFRTVEFMGQLFFAKSFSAFNDPWKQFFHKVRYYKVDTEHVEKNIQKPPRYNNRFRGIPVDMQNGVLTFSPDMETMVSAVIQYKNIKATVELTGKESRPFCTKLFYSTLKNNKKRYTKYRPVFEQDDAYSYTHPFLFNNGKSLLFASDMEGGYGGFDLYVAHFNEYDGKWSTPINLGSSVNTEGDEISPVLFHDRLLFASSGHPGYGGYDLFSTLYSKDGVLPNGIYHFPYPVNSVYNDYSLQPTSLHAGYFVSDRDLGSHDDIYFLKSNEEFGTVKAQPYFGMNEERALAGGQLLMNGLLKNPCAETIEIKIAPKGLLLTLYFEFDSDKLTQESLQRLSLFLRETKEYRFNELYFDGFADEFGTEAYNNALSERRARNVADYLKEHGVSPRIHVIGHGRQKLSPSEIQEELSHFPWQESQPVDWIKVNQRSRRVEIHNRQTSSGHTHRELHK